MFYMSKTDKLMEKLRNGTIDAVELRSLLIKVGAECSPGRGSHEKWTLNGKVMILATHSNDLKKYQIKEAQNFLGVK